MFASNGFKVTARGRLLAAAGLTLLASSGTPAVPPVEIRERERVQLEIRALDATPPGSAAAWHIDVDPESGGETRFELAWPEPGERVTLRIRAREIPTAPESRHLVELEAQIERSGVEGRTARRRIEFEDETTALFEVLRDPGASLTLAVVATTKPETVVKRASVAGAPIRFRLEIQRITGEEAVTLETNLLQSFVGQPVSYSFDLGSESGHLTLLARRVSGELAEVDVEVSGRLPGHEGPQLLSRREHWITSRGVRSTFSFEAGDPPTGYRFAVTPSF